MLAHNELESAEDVVLGLDGMTLHESTCAGVDEGRVDCDHQFAPAGELGNNGGGRTTSTIRGGGGNSGRKRPMMLCLTSSLFPQSNSPQPSSSNPSKADTCVRYTNLLIDWMNSSCNFLTCISFSDQLYVLADISIQWISLWYSMSDSIESGVSLNATSFRKTIST